MLGLCKNVLLSITLCFAILGVTGCGGGSSETTINEPSGEKEQVLGDMTEEEMKAKMEADMAASRPGKKK